MTTGAELILSLARDAGGEVCFANPGTTELALVAALDAVHGVRPVLGLFEGVCSGAADGWGRMRDAPALALLHLGPGFANAMANLHNARRAGTPVFAVVGDHATWHRPVDAPLTSDVEAMAGAVSGWVRTTTTETLADDVVAGLRAALGGAVATLVVPSDVQDAAISGDRPAAPHGRVRPPVDDEAVESAARTLRAVGDGGLLLLGGDACRAVGLRAAARIAAATGCRLLLETFPARQERGGGLPAVPRLPYLPDAARQALDGTRALVLAGARDPVSFFGYAGEESRLAPADAEVVPLAEQGAAAADALLRLADAVDAPAGLTPSSAAAPEVPRDQPLHAGTLGPLFAAVQPEGAVVVDEATTSGLLYAGAADGAAAHDVLALTGGAIGYGLPAAVGAALAVPEREVLALQADGSGLYTLQALWTMAREGLDVTVAVLANDAYRILQVEMARGGLEGDGPARRDLVELGRPRIDWVHLAHGFGVPATRADDTTSAERALREALAEPGPSLVELRVQ